MHTVIYDGTFEGWLCAVFDVYEYRLKDVELCTTENFHGNIFEKIHHVHFDAAHAQRVWKGLEARLSTAAQKQVYRAFLSEQFDNVLLRYVQYVFASKAGVENDYSHPDVINVVQMARKVWREKHRMEAFVRFEKTADGLYYSMVEPDYNVLPLIARHFTERYADQRWMIYDGRRKYGIHYDLEQTSFVSLLFSDQVKEAGTAAVVYDEKEDMYQELWKRYFSSVNIAARKNMKLHVQHMPKRYWKHLTEKRK